MTATDQPPGAPSTTTQRTRVRALAAALTVTMSAVLPPMLTGTMAERMRAALGVGETSLGLALALFFTLSALLSSRGGRLADRIGWARAGRIAVIGSVTSLVGIALLVRDVWTLAAFLALGGAAMGAAMPAGSLAIAQELSRERQGLLFGVKQTSIPLAGLFAGAAVPAVALTLGWRWAFGLATVFPLTALALLPRDGANAADRPAQAQSGGPATAPSSNGAPTPAPLPRAFPLLSLGGGLAAVAISAMVAFLVIAAVDAGIAEGTAGILVAAASGLGLSVRVVSGWLADRSGSDGFRPVAAMQAIGALGFVLLAVHVPVTVVVGALIAYTAGWGWPGLFYFGAVVYGPDAPAAATGAIQVGLSGGSAVGPLLFGLTAEHLGFHVAWSGAAVLMVLAATMVTLGTRRLGAPPTLPVST